MAKIGIIMGSNSDWHIMEHAAKMLQQFGVDYETQVVSAHRTPDLMFDYAKTAHERGLQAIIAGAGGAAHLPGMVAAQTTLPVLGVPVPSKYLRGEDSLLSIVQMPKGVPVATFAIGEAGAANAALFAVKAGGFSRAPNTKRAGNEPAACWRRLVPNKQRQPENEREAKTAARPISIPAPSPQGTRHDRSRIPRPI